MSNEKNNSDELYKLSNLERLGELVELAPESLKAFLHFDDVVYKDGHFSLKIKEAIAVAVAHVTGCAYCMETHAKRFKEAGGTKEEMMEAIVVASTVMGGGTLARGVNALNAYDRGTKPATTGHGPDCFF